MLIGVNLGPTANWTAVLEAARKADAYGFDAIGFLDHYHATKPEWGYLSGWPLYGALAVATTRIKLIPLVVCGLNYLPGILAREATMLAVLSGGRFELGIGAGDYFEEMRAWGIAVPDASERIERLQEMVQVLQKAWTGELFTFEGKHFHIHDALCAPVPATSPRIVVGTGSSRRLLHSAVEYADELNVYASEELMREARSAIEASGRKIALSTYVWDWRDDIEEKLKEWEQLGVERTFITFWEPFTQLEQVARWIR